MAFLSIETLYEKYHIKNKIKGKLSLILSRTRFFYRIATFHQIHFISLLMIFNLEKKTANYSLIIFQINILEIFSPVAKYVDGSIQCLGDSFNTFRYRGRKYKCEYFSFAYYFSSFTCEF